MRIIFVVKNPEEPFSIMFTNMKPKVRKEHWREGELGNIALHLYPSPDSPVEGKEGLLRLGDHE